MHIVLVHPEIAGNTGNIIRLCANVGASLHLVDPIGFSLADRLLQRAGLDYHDLTDVHRHPDWATCRDALPPVSRWALTSRGTRTYAEAPIGPTDVLVYGCESVGLPDAVLAEFSAAHRLAIPMRPNNRSLNLANSVALVAYDVWRRHDYDGAVNASNVEEAAYREGRADRTHGGADHDQQDARRNDFTAADGELFQ